MELHLENYFSNFRSSSNISPMGTLTIYLADDDLEDREFFAFALLGLPISAAVIHFSEGGELIRALCDDSQCPDAIFLDLNMPGMGGFECLSRVRGMERFHKTPIIMYSTAAHRIDVLRAMESGANRYLKKPSSMNQLKTVLYKYLRELAHPGQMSDDFRVLS